MPFYAQVVVGPPGSGKSTYCNGMQQYLRLLGREALVINLDPANEVDRVLPPPTPSGDGHTSAPPLPPSSYQRPKQQESKQADAGDVSSQHLPYDTLFDVCEEVINLSSVIDQLGLGPNGGLVYCMEYLEAHVEEVIVMIQERVTQEEEDRRRQNSNNTNQQERIPPLYLLIDLPGQVELYTHSTCVQSMLHQLTQRLDLRLAAVQCIDALYCTDSTKFLSAALLGTATLIRLELPMVSVLTKVDLLAQYGEESLPFGLEFFTDCHDLHRLVPFLDTSVTSTDPLAGRDTSDSQSGNAGGNGYTAAAVLEEEFDYGDDPDYQKARRKTRQSRFFKKRAKLHQALAEVVEDFGLLGFLTLDITSAESVGRVLARIDKCNGYVFTESTVTQDMFQCAVQAESDVNESIADIQERLIRRQQQQQRTPQR